MPILEEFCQASFLYESQDLGEFQVFTKWQILGNLLKGYKQHLTYFFVDALMSWCG